MTPSSGAKGTAHHPIIRCNPIRHEEQCCPNSFSECDVVVAAGLFLASAVIAIAGIATAVRPFTVMPRLRT